MSPLQYRRWYSFARRMALRAYPSATPARRQKIAWEVRCLIRAMKDDAPAIVDWDSGPVYPCDTVLSLLDESHFHYRIDKKGNEIERGNRFNDQVVCCVRAGLDMATEIGGGVLGFTVGDLRRMFPFGIPDWVAAHYGPMLTLAPDSDGVWL